MALIITLIMLSVTLVMAVAYLALSQRQRNAVSTTTDTTTARLADDSALSAAQSQIIASILATNAAAYNYHLLVSTNYINSYGFVPGVANITNVNYDYLYSGGSLSSADLITNIANLEILPRAPVYVVTNQATGSNDFRYYLDLNRNGVDDPNNNITNYDSSGGIIYDTSNNPVVNSRPGDPEWIGVLEHPDQPHGPDNRFVARYAFLAQPIGNSLDLNYIHNQAFYKNVSGNDGFYRNQGVGSWEINLAAFLADLNTNQWDSPTVENPINNPYLYRLPSGYANQGAAFEDAQALLSWRYGNSYNSLATADQLFPSANIIFPRDGIDEYSDGGLQTTVSTNLEDIVADDPSQPWAGADSVNHFYSLDSDLFDPTKSSPNFVTRLKNASTYRAPNGVQPTYDRYTFYRLLDQLGTASSPESGKLNLNYSNAVVRYDANGVMTGVTIIPGAQTNLVPWRPLDFFTAAANKMLRLYTTNWFQANPPGYLASYYGFTNWGGIYTNLNNIRSGYYYVENGLTNIYQANGYGLTNIPLWGMTNEIPAFGITNIPVYVNGNFVYRPAVNRVLQLAANLYDATTNQTERLGANFPSVFRPMILVTNQYDPSDFLDRNVYVQGYEQVTTARAFGNGGGNGTGVLGVNTNNINVPLPRLLYPPYTIAQLRTPGFTYPHYDINIYGVPWILGAKKGFPSFNQLFMDNYGQVTRKLEVGRKPVSASLPNVTNQMYVMSFKARMGLSFWNSYNTNFPYPLQIHAYDRISMALTNAAGTVVWPRFGPPTYAYFPFNLTVNSWPGSQWYGQPPNQTVGNPYSFIYTNWTYTFMPDAVYRFSTASFDTNSYATNLWETTTPQLPPLPHFGLSTTNLLQAYILENSPEGTKVVDYVQLQGPASVRDINQELFDSADTSMWSTNVDKNGIQYGIKNQLEVSETGQNLPVPNAWRTPPYFPAGSIANQAEFFREYLSPFSTNTQPYVQAPYTPTRTVYDVTRWQANDPLVHYLASDLNYVNPGVYGIHRNDDTLTTPLPSPDLTTPGKRYQPWGRNAQMSQLGGVLADAYDLGYKDPLVWGSDSWDFPTNKYPSVGWIGRVHRGTPWQTIYLKATNIVSYANGATTGWKTWEGWSGDQNFADALNSRPTQDRLLFDVFTTALNDNATRGTLSVDQTHLASWSALLSGMVVLTNSVNMPSWISSYFPPSNTWMTVQPAGPEGNASPLGQIVNGPNGINASRANTNWYPTGTFTHKGDILSVPALTDKSPFLNWNNTAQHDFGISDAAYEWLPQQMMSLVRGPSGGGPQYVVYCFGQTLQPAPNGTVLSGPYFGMVTNYQITAESDARAVIRVVPHATATGTNYTTVVESYNQLPPN